MIKQQYFNFWLCFVMISEPKKRTPFSIQEKMDISPPSEYK